jgi:hypothetical protein
MDIEKELLIIDDTNGAFLFIEKHMYGTLCPVFSRCLFHCFGYLRVRHTPCFEN